MTTTYADHSRPWWQRLLVNRDAAMILILLLVIEYSISHIVYFGTRLTMTYLLLDNAPVLLIALPMTMVIVTGEIDLSVASALGLSSVVLGALHRDGMGMPLAASVALLVGVACGLLNGYLVAYVGLPSLAVTIGTLALFRGLAVGLLGTTAVTDFPTSWTDLATRQIGGTGVPLITLVFVVLALAFALLLQYSPFGRGVYDIGLNSEAAAFTGVNVRRTKLILFVFTGTVSAFAGIYFTLRYGSARGDNATGLEMQVIAAVLLGGVSIFGGRGRLPGVVAGVLLIGVISSALRLKGVTVNVTNIIIGLLLIASVVSTRALSWVPDIMSRRTRKGIRPQQTPVSVETQGR